MKNLRWMLPSLGLIALIGTGCIITSAQIFAHFDLPNPITINSATDPFELVPVDLSTVSDYNDNKDKLKGLSDLAVVGKFTNVAGPAGGVEVWITPGVTSFTTVAQITAGATKLWGPASIGAAGSATAAHNVTWDESTALFNPAGKKILIDESLGDGVFTIYTFGTAGVYSIKVDDGALILVIAAST